ncbi:hypothetical protein BELL_0358g00100 [Botrytis elliptica]|uniref:DUF7918 domain-containing protein n=1 Tax=Botrytis elliptica TaxID=278938 RepID=A0A4Z1JIC8_9HELO|nr:hypothetical protein EAE99_003427 [Botrytis elliptica]TGO73475.1 hypothetical protein BELL_0358g00100 [Botrytis elliptica]
MAILNTSQGEVEVRIKRYPDDTYYDEYIKVERKERGTDTKRERYIVAEPDTTYYIEVTLKAGFDFGDNDVMGANLHFSGRDKRISGISFWEHKYTRKLKEDIVRNIQYAYEEVVGEKVLGARFFFRQIEIDEDLSDETDVLGIHPDSLVTFSVRLFLYKKHIVKLSDDEYDKAVLEFQHASASVEHNTSALGPQDRVVDPAVIQPNTRNLWDVKKVDKDSFKKRGIRSAIGFSGGTKQPNVPARDSMHKKGLIVEPQPPERTTTTYNALPCSGTFEFHCRAAEFLEVVGIIKYPPPLHCYSWGMLNENERKIALTELQELSKKQWREDREKETGLILPNVGSRIKSEDDPWEWRHWDKMYAAEKRKAFENLQNEKKDRERGIVQREFKNVMGEIISLDVEDDKPSRKPLEKGRYNSKGGGAKSGKEGVLIKREEIQRATANSLDAQQTTGVNISKHGIINIDEGDDSIIIVSETKNPILSLAPKEEEIEEGITLADEELRKEEAALEKLKEDIAQEERVIKMKRERDALQEKIDAARSKKRIKTE